MFFVCVFHPHDDEVEQSSDADYELRGSRTVLRDAIGGGSDGLLTY